jgi:hypothetical protein
VVSRRPRLTCILAGVLVGLASSVACRPAGHILRGDDDRGPQAFRTGDSNGGAEPYSAWFGDTDGRVLYFGASPFWTLWWDSNRDATADLREPGDHLIGRFDMRDERFLAPLRVRTPQSKPQSSVWDVLVHSNGRIYYTTYFEEIGSVLPDGTDVHHFGGVGTGFNELVEGPQGHVYLTRYGTGSESHVRREGGSVVVLTPEGNLVHEFPVQEDPEVFAAPKSLAVDPLTGEIWCNADLLSEGNDPAFVTYKLSPTGEIVARSPAPPELQFVAFGREGTGWFAEADEGRLRLRATRGGQEIARTSLGRPERIDFVQDIKPISPDRAVLSLWSGRAFVAFLDGRFLTAAEVRFQRPADCVPPEGRSILYTAVAYRDSLYATLYCGWTILRAPIPGR